MTKTFPKLIENYNLSFQQLNEHQEQKQEIYKGHAISKWLNTSDEISTLAAAVDCSTVGNSPFSSVQSLSRVQLFVTPCTTAHQASLSITNSRSPPKPTSVESVMPSNHLILCRPLLLPPWIFPSIRVSSNESALLIRWPKYWSFNRWF